jgi:hypothetical protein
LSGIILLHPLKNTIDIDGIKEVFVEGGSGRIIQDADVPEDIKNIIAEEIADKKPSHVSGLNYRCLIR